MRTTNESTESQTGGLGPVVGSSIPKKEEPKEKWIPMDNPEYLKNNKTGAVKHKDL